MKKNKKTIFHHGFYMIEAVFAMFLVTVGMLSTVALISGTLKNSMFDRDQAAAVLLAQEGTELVRNIRDNNFAADVSGGAFNSSFPSGNSAQCRIDSSANSLDCSGASYQLNLNSNNYYVHSTTSTTATKFRRRIAVKYSTAGGSGDLSNYATTTSVVTWNGSAPPDPTAAGFPGNCQATAGCVYSQVVLTRWAQ